MDAERHATLLSRIYPGRKAFNAIFQQDGVVPGIDNSVAALRSRYKIGDEGALTSASEA
jgi:hypothetical protein